MTSMTIKMTSRLFAVLLFSALLSACASASKSYVVLLEDADGSTGKVVVQGNKGERVIDQAKYGASLDGSLPAARIPDEKIAQDFGAALAASPLAPERFLLYFESGAQLTEESLALFSRIADSVAVHPAADVSIIGHTDTVGDPDKNETLAQERAQSIADLLSAQGLEPYALSVESHGERNLLVPTPDETPEPRNRRVEVSVR